MAGRHQVSELLILSLASLAMILDTLDHINEKSSFQQTSSNLPYLLRLHVRSKSFHCTGKEGAKGMCSLGLHLDTELRIHSKAST